jgi:hypothetical protein
MLLVSNTEKGPAIRRAIPLPVVELDNTQRKPFIYYTLTIYTPGGEGVLHGHLEPRT